MSTFSRRKKVQHPPGDKRLRVLLRRLCWLCCDPAPSYFRRPSATLRQRLLGSTNSVSSKSSRPEDRSQLTALWQQLKSDIESAMAKKPAGNSQKRAESGQYKRFSVITKEVGRLSYSYYLSNLIYLITIPSKYIRIGYFDTKLYWRLTKASNQSESNN